MSLRKLLGEKQTVTVADPGQWKSPEAVLLEVSVERRNDLRADSEIVDAFRLFGWLDVKTESFKQIYKAEQDSNLTVLADGDFLVTPDFGGSRYCRVSKNGKTVTVFKDPELVFGHETSTGFSIAANKPKTLLYGVPLEQSEGPAPMKGYVYLQDVMTGKRKLLRSGRHLTPEDYNGPCMAAAISPNADRFVMVDLKKLDVVRIFRIGK